VARAARPSPAPAERTHAEQDLWTKVDGALEAWLAPADPALAAAAAAATQAGLPEIAVSPAQGRFLEVLARATGARRILEIGTLAGYSTIWLARALPADGRLVTLEIDPGRARLARENLERAGLGTRVEVIDGPALGSLTVLRAARADPFDLVFIDADKQSSRAYVENALALSRPGTVVVVDNVVRDGRVIDPDTGDAGVDGVRSMMDWIASHPRLRASALQTVGAKGHDGMLLAVVEDGPPGTGVSG
jgi:predicted O-methyltransferase YrrM